MPDFIFTMKALGKVYPPDSKVFEDIYLSFYYGAKIGVLGGNGAGKSTLLRIMAGLDQEFIGEARLGQSFTVGHLSQEPQLDPKKNVFGNVDEGVAPIRALLTRFDEINAKFGEDLSPEDMDKVLEEQAKVQDQIDAAGAWDLDSKLEHAMDALRLPPGDADVTKLSGGERRRGVGGMARALSQGIQGLGRGHHARSLFPRQRRRLDPRTGSRQGVPVGGQLLVVARAEAEPARARGETGIQAPADSSA